MSLSYLICSGKIFFLPPFGANGQIANIYDFYFTHLDTLIKGFEYIIMSLKIRWPTCTTRHCPCGSLNSLIHLTFEYVTRVLLSPLLVSNVHFSMELSVIRGHWVQQGQKYFTQYDVMSQKTSAGKAKTEKSDNGCLDTNDPSVGGKPQLSKILSPNLC